jgi:transcriptional regulator with XRE-family HTH domain
MNAINENLKLLRQASGMTQTAVADAISVSRQTVSSYESGRTQPDLETLKRLAEVYHADLLDVLYGGNRLQRRLKQIKFAAIILAVILLLGILIHSVLLCIENNLFAMTPGNAVTADQKLLIDIRLTLRHIAETASSVCTTVFSVGCIIMLYPIITVIHTVSFRKLFLFYLVMIAAMLACTVPFGVTDKVFGLSDYLFPLWIGLIVVLLFFLVIVSAKLIKRRRSK